MQDHHNQSDFQGGSDSERCLTEKDAMLAWIHWWRNGWRKRRHLSWPLPTELLSFAYPLTESASRETTDRFFGIAPVPAPYPAAGLITLIKLPQEKWSYLFKLCFSICAVGLPPPYFLANIDDEKWCRRVAKGLKPGLWLPPYFACPEPDIYGIWLLRCWSIEPVWLRMRFCLDKNKVEAAEHPVVESPPLKRLSTLLQAVISRVDGRPLQENKNAKLP